MAPVNGITLIEYESPNGGRSGSKRNSSQSPQNELTRLTGICFKSSAKKKMEANKISKFVPRNDFGQEGKLLPVVSNHFPLQVSAQTVYHYDVEIEKLRSFSDQPSVGDYPEDILGAIRGRGPNEGSMRRFRKLSYKINRFVIEELVKTNSSTEDQTFFDRIPVYDGQKNLYAAKPLIGIGTDCGPMKQKRLFVKIKENGDNEQKYAVNIQYASHIDLNAINSYYKRRATEIPAEAIQALDIILRHGPNLYHIPIGNSLYQSETVSQRQALGSGRQLAFGHYQSVRPCMNGSMLVIDRTATAFYQSGSLINFVAQILGGNGGSGGGSNNKPDINLQTIPALRDYDRKRVERELRTLQIEVTHLSYRRKYRVLGLTQVPAQEVSFKWDRDGEDRGHVKIPDYFREEYGKTLKFANMPCVIIGNGNRKKYFPMEVCNLVQDQHIRKKLTNDQTAQMIRSTASQKPTQRFEVIVDSVQSVINQSHPYMNEFGIQIKSTPLVVDARVLDAPELCLRGVNVKPRDGVWSVERRRLHDVQHIENWVVVNFSVNVSDAEAKKFVTELKTTAGQMGINVEEPARIARVNSYKPKQLKSIFEKAKTTCTGLKIIFFIIPNDDNLYQEIKLVGDVQLGIATQCIAERNIRRCSTSLLSNLLLKVNTKLGGTNAILCAKNKPPILDKRVMIIGADVTHPAPADKLTSSVAAVVGSTDDDYTRFYAAVSIQAKCKQEMIKDLDVMMKELLEEYRRQHRSQLPESIIIYRDGVSEGQFEQVLNHEVGKLQAAFGSIKSNYSPKVTFIVVQKRHHTRFMPSDESQGVGKYRNIPPGTTVDTDVVHPSDFDFFLCSHFGIQGTSRPTHYHVLWDDHKFSADELQKLTYYLCHTYAKCARSISVPAPVQYAHLAAYRARVHIIGIGGSESGGSDNYQERNSSRASLEDSKKELSFIKSLNESIRIQKEFKKQMYFC